MTQSPTPSTHPTNQTSSASIPKHESLPTSTQNSTTNNNPTNTTTSLPSYFHPNYHPAAQNEEIRQIIADIFYNDELLIDSKHIINMQYVQRKKQFQSQLGKLAPDSTTPELLSEKLLYIRLYLPRAPDIFLPLLNVLAAFHQYAPAFNYYAYCLENAIGMPAPNTVRAMNYYRKSMETFHDADSIFALGILEMKRKKWNEALQLFEAGKRINSCHNCHYYLAVCHMDHRKDFLGALRLLEELIESHSQSLEYGDEAGKRTHISEEDTSLGSTPKKKLSMKRAPVLWSAVHSRIAQCSEQVCNNAIQDMKANRLSQAHDLFEEVSKYECVRFKSLYYLACIYSRGYGYVLPNLEKAVHFFKRCFKSAVQSLEHLLWVLDSLHFHEALQKGEDTDDFYLMTSESLACIGPTEACFKYLRPNITALYQKVLEYEPNSVSVVIQLGICYRDGVGLLPNQQKALELFSTAKELAPEDDEVDLLVRSLRHKLQISSSYRKREQSENSSTPPTPSTPSKSSAIMGSVSESPTTPRTPSSPICPGSFSSLLKKTPKMSNYNTQSRSPVSFKFTPLSPVSRHGSSSSTEFSTESDDTTWSTASFVSKKSRRTKKPSIFENISHQLIASSCSRK